MTVLISVLIFLVCIMLVLVVLVQNSKGGGLAAGFSSSNQIMGVRKTTDFLEKATWYLAIALLVLCLFAAIFQASNTVVVQDSKSLDYINPNQAPAAAQNAQSGPGQ